MVQQREVLQNARGDVGGHSGPQRWRAHRLQGIVEQFDCGQPVPRPSPTPDREISLRMGKVGVFIQRYHPWLYARKIAHQRAQTRQIPAGAKRGRHHQHHRPRLGIKIQTPHAKAQGFQRGRSRRAQIAAGIGQFHPAVDTAEQRLAQLCL